MMSARRAAGRGWGCARLGDPAQAAGRGAPGRARVTAGRRVARRCPRVSPPPAVSLSFCFRRPGGVAPRIRHPARLRLSPLPLRRAPPARSAHLGQCVKMRERVSRCRRGWILGVCPSPSMPADRRDAPRARRPDAVTTRPASPGPRTPGISPGTGRPRPRQGSRRWAQTPCPQRAQGTNGG